MLLSATDLELQRTCVLHIGHSVYMPTKFQAKGCLTWQEPVAMTMHNSKASRSEICEFIVETLLVHERGWMKIGVKRKTGKTWSCRWYEVWGLPLSNWGIVLFRTRPVIDCERTWSQPLVLSDPWGVGLSYLVEALLDNNNCAIV